MLKGSEVDKERERERKATPAVDRFVISLDKQIKGARETETDKEWL